MEGRQTGSDGYRAAACGLRIREDRPEAGGHEGFAQNVAFLQRRILEDRSQVALVRDGREDVLGSATT